MSATNKLGARVRQLREMRAMTLEQLAQQSQCHIDLLHRIEAGEEVPSLAPLMEIARALGLRLGTLLDDEPQPGPLLVRAGQSPNVIRFSGKGARTAGSNLVFNAMAAGKQDRHMEPFLIDVEPCSDDNPPLSCHEGEEFLYVLAGTVLVRCGDQLYTLEEGDSLYYDSIVPHSVSTRAGIARLLAVVYTPF